MKHKILFVAANPRDTDELALHKECAAIENELRMVAARDDFHFCSRWTVSIDDLMRGLNELSPTVVHFSGHGSRTTRARGVSRRDAEASGGAGILLQDGNGDGAQRVSERALARMIKCASLATRLVVLNACYSAEIADSLRQVVDCVIGVDGAIDDTTARSFAVALYRALGNRRSVGNAVEQVMATLDAKQQLDHLVVCQTRDGVVADNMFLVAPDRRPDAEAANASDAGMDTAMLRPPVATKATGSLLPGTSASCDLFLACPAVNDATAGALLDLLQPDIRVFLAGRSLPPGEDRERDIRAAQRAARATVLLISRQSDAAWYLGDEVLDAIALHRAAPGAHRLILLLLEPGIAVPASIRQVTAIDATAIGGLAGVAGQLRRQVAEIHEQAARAASASWPAMTEPANSALGRRDRYLLYERLVQIGDAVFEQVVSRAGIELARFAPRAATLSARAVDLAQSAALDPALCRRVSTELDRRAPWTRR